MAQRFNFWGIKEKQIIPSKPKTNLPGKSSRCYQGEKLDRQSAVYAEGTRFMCGRCIYYRGGKCAIVKGSISPTGCCNLFKNRAMVYKR